MCLLPPHRSLLGCCVGLLVLNTYTRPLFVFVFCSTISCVCVCICVFSFCFLSKPAPRPLPRCDAYTSSRRLFGAPPPSPPSTSPLAAVSTPPHLSFGNSCRMFTALQGNVGALLVFVLCSLSSSACLDAPSVFLCLTFFSVRRLFFLCSNMPSAAYS